MTELTEPRAGRACRASRPSFHLADLADLSLLDLLDLTGAGRTGGMVRGLADGVGRWWRDRPVLFGDLGWRLAAISVTAALDCVAPSTVTRALAQAITVGAVTVALARSGSGTPSGTDTGRTPPHPDAAADDTVPNRTGGKVVVHEVVPSAGQLFVVMTVLDPPGTPQGPDPRPER